MAKGFKSGGRIAGTPNKATSDLQTKLDALGCDPIKGLAQIAMDAQTPVALRAKCLAEIAPYVYPKRKAIEHRGEDGPPIQHAHTIRFVE